MEEEVNRPTPAINKKLIFGIVGILAVAAAIIIVLSSFFPILWSQSHEYKVSVTHNGKPLELSNGAAADRNFYYLLDLYNKSSYCGNENINSGNTQSPNFAFNSSSISGFKTLKEYEKDGYAFDFLVSNNPTDMSAYWAVALVAKDALNPELYYNELPKLSNSLSITFEVPIFNTSSFSTNVSGTTINVHAELIDDWKPETPFYCRLSRPYDPSTDVSLPDCPLSFSIANLSQCAEKEYSDCDQQNQVLYRISAAKNGRNLNCIIPLGDLTSKKNYILNFFTAEQIKPNIYQLNFNGMIANISIP